MHHPGKVFGPNAQNIIYFPARNIYVSFPRGLEKCGSDIPINRKAHQEQRAPPIFAAAQYMHMLLSRRKSFAPRR